MKRPDAANRTVLAGVRNMAAARNAIAVQPNGFVYMDFAFTSSFDAALAGVSSVLLIRPTQLTNTDLYFKPFVKAIKRSGVQQVIFLSVQGVENNRLDGHYKIEKLIVEAGLPFVFLRPCFFMQNLSKTHQSESRDQSEIFVLAGRAKTSFVDVRDVGAVATLILSSFGTEYLNRGYQLTGSEALSYGKIAGVLTNALGRKITYRNPSASRFIWQKWQQEKIPVGVTMSMLARHTASKLGKFAGLSDEMERLLKRRPGTFRRFTEAYRAS